jgi:hypothetical protein
MGRRKRDGNHSPSQNKIIQDLEQNEENGYPDPDSNKTKVNYTKEPNEDHNNTLKEEILQLTNENFIEMLLAWSTKYTGDTQEIPRQQK